ncbi:endonuclease domain-containing protein [Streptomyces caelestis]|uniref:endonuclease domain-containing protein n=1 Tax=Streptomyces caelestis TaxID=36816 RepID=UPI0036FF1695
MRAVSARGLCTGHYQQRMKGQLLSPLRRKRGNGAIQEMIERGIIECRECGEHKPVSEFSTLNASGVPRPYCKPCNAERVRLGHYNLTKEFVCLLLRFQEGRCALCGAVGTGQRAMDIDHDHACCPGRRSCGECVRGLVCSSCNFHALGWYEALPPELRTFDLLNTYLADPPAKRLRGQLVAPAGG